MDEFQKIASAKKALDDGIITEEEYETFKWNIINLTDTSQISKQRNEEKESKKGVSLLGIFLVCCALILIFYLIGYYI